MLRVGPKKFPLPLEAQNPRFLLAARSILHDASQILKARGLCKPAMSASSDCLPSPLAFMNGTIRRSPISLPYCGRKRRFYSSVASHEGPDAQIQQFYEDTRPSESVIQARNATISRLNTVINGAFGGGYSVKSFGSTVYGIDYAKSDLDLVVLDSRFPEGFRRPQKMKRHHIYRIKTLAGALRDRRFKVTQVVETALVPIVKFVDSRTGIRCDLNVNERLGLRNTALLEKYCEIMPQLRILVFLVKQWARANSLNSPSPGRGSPASFSSYALTLMTIGHLQLQRLLPNLQEGFHPDNRDPSDGKFIFWAKTRDGNLACDTRFHTEVDWKSPSDYTVSALFESWLQHWVHFDYKHHGISVREGRLLKRTYNGMHKESKPIRQMEENSTGDETSTGPTPEPSCDNTVEKGENSSPDLIKSVPASEKAKFSQVSGEPGVSGSPGSYCATSGLLVVMDPFILSKNVCLNIGQQVLHEFRDSGMRTLAAMAREGGYDLGELIGQEPEVSVGKKHKKGK